MTLRGARVALGPNRAKRLDIAIRGPARTVDLEGHLILPGLINAHDHLSFNLFPLLGRPPYANATEWAHDIYHPDESPIREHRSIPREVRLSWGAIKNLVSGVTAVAHHDPDPARMLANLPIRIAKTSWAHSIAFTPDLARRFRGTRPFIIHAGEGTDEVSRDEIFALDKLRVLDERTVIVHGVAFDPRGLRLMKARRASLIACPVSNLFTLRRTLEPSVFRAGIPIALGTDSPLTAPGDLLDALRAARSIWRLSAARLYEMVTTIPASILRLPSRTADWIVIQDPGSTPAEALIDLRRVEIAIVGGRIRLVAGKFAHLAGGSFEMLEISDRGRFLIDAPVRALYQEAAARLGTAPRLAGRRVRIK